MTRALQMQKAAKLLHQRHHIIAMTRHGPFTEMTEENANSVEVKVEATAPAPAPSASLATAAAALADIEASAAADLRAANAEARFFLTRSMLSCPNDSRAGHVRRIICPNNEKNVAMVSYFLFLLLSQSSFLTICHASILIMNSPFIICDLYYGFGT
jgi:hypothetical protein